MQRLSDKTKFDLAKVGREFREVTGQQKPCGVYAIVFPNQKRYVGASVDIASRFKQHVKLLRKGQHWCEPLQLQYRNYGEEYIIPVLLELCEPDKLHEVEDIWIECAFYSKLLLNRSAFSVPRYERTVEERKRMSDSAKGVPRRTKGKTYLEIYGTSEPSCGFKRGDENVAKRSVVRRRISETLRRPGVHGAYQPEHKETFIKQAERMRLAKNKKQEEEN